MAELKNCLLPEDLRYHIEYNVWIRDNADGTHDIGMTDIAQSMAGAMIHCRPKKVGKVVKAGKSVATVESGKWVGPVKSPFEAEILERNDAIEADATILNRSPYTQGWIVRVKAVEGDSALAGLLDVEAAAAGFAAYMAEKEIEECIHCEGFDG